MSVFHIFHTCLILQNKFNVPFTDYIQLKPCIQEFINNLLQCFIHSYSYNIFFVKNSEHSEMSNIDLMDRYTNPPIPSKTDTIYKSYSHFSAGGNVPNEDQVVYVQQPNPNDYPKNAGYARFPVMVNCEKCGALNMTEIQYLHGFASKFWCLLLLPIMCTGSCCLCLNSCKDVEHKCSKCHAMVGLNKSSIC